MHINAKDRADALLDRQSWLYHKPARGIQMGLAFVNALIRAKRQTFLTDQVGRSINRLG